MIRQNRKIQFIILITLVCLVGTMTIAYAVLSTTLNITGTAQVQDASWDIHFENVQVNPNSVPISPKITDNDKITFQADLTTPGQFYKFTVDIINEGTIDAMIESIIKNPELTDEQKKYLRYEVEYTDRTSINETQLLKSGETKTISVLVSYRNDIPTTDLPKTETNLDLEVRLLYVQATSLGTEIQNGDNPIKVVSGDLNTVGSEICIEEECFYLMKNDGYNVTMLAKYNLYVGYLYDGTTWTAYEEATGIQNSTMIGWFADDQPRNGVRKFASTPYWTDVTSYPAYIFDSRATIYQYVMNYKEYIEQQGIIVEKARLIKYEELVGLGCDESSKTCLDSTYSWIYSTSFHSGDAATEEKIWVVFSDGRFIKNDPFNMNGVRPVLEVPLTEF